jgi:imidazolonepropionase-like amidohydrolase
MSIMKRFLVLALFALAVVPTWPMLEAQGNEQILAIVGATVIDGNGAEPLPNATVLVVGKRIKAVGPRSSIEVPPAAHVIDGAGKFVTPGFIDSNVHLSMFGNLEQLARFGDRSDDITLESAQLFLKYGVTTVRDSYGQLRSLVKVRDAIGRGEAVGPRMLVAGNIVGWGGPFSITFSYTRDVSLSPFQARFNDEITQGSGEDLLDMTPEELRIAINKYLDKGPNFIKYGGTTHQSDPTLITFSPDAQKVIVDETHKRGLSAETHSTSLEGLRLSVLAGVDLIQHPEILGPRDYTESLLKLIVERKVICAISVNNWVHGEHWQNHLKDKAEAEKRAKAMQMESGSAIKGPKTFAEMRKEREDLGLDLEADRRNAQALIRAGAIIATASDTTVTYPPEFVQPPKPLYRQAGIASLVSIEGMVELGMTPLQAITAGTKHGAMACKMLKDLGTVEAGKYADLVLLDANPIANIRNIRAQRLVMKEGRIIEVDRLPQKPILYRPAGGSK